MAIALGPLTDAISSYRDKAWSKTALSASSAVKCSGVIPAAELVKVQSLLDMCFYRI